MKNLAFTNASGGVSVIHPAAKEDLETTLGVLTDEQYSNRVLADNLREGVITAETQLYEVDDSSLPDREFRNAWILEDGSITHDLEKARAIQLERIRLAREPKLAELDQQYMLSLEQGNTTAIAEIVSQKQVLRDITEPLKVAELTSIEDVKEAFPDVLKADENDQPTDGD